LLDRAIASLDPEREADRRMLGERLEKIRP
jgi:hypothetical protein